MGKNYPPIPPAAAPIRKIFDPWNSASTGHQRAENRLSGSTSWRQSRTTKLRNQFAGGAGGGKCMFDSVGAGNPDFGKDGRQENGSWVKGAPGLREQGWRDIGLMISKGGTEEKKAQQQDKVAPEKEYPETLIGITEEKEHGYARAESRREKKVFQDCSFYLNGSTAPLVSDHKLKQLISENGGRVSLGLARRSVTHVIIGRPNGLHQGAGGGLSGSKIEKEIQRVRGCGIKFVNVEWVLDSMKAGRRLPEYKFEGVKTAPHGVKSVATMFNKKAETKEP